MSIRKRGQGMNWCRLSTRMAIYSRDGFACVYCGSGAELDGRGLTLDHVTAVELGGDNSPENLVSACLSCNSAKKDLPTRAWFARLRDRGVDTAKVGARVRRLTARKLDRSEGIRLSALRRGV
jgi:5-methylcytosine-specific restriction endonuclease McrA